MGRVARGVLWARECQRPAGMPTRRPGGAAARGLQYEDRLAGALGPAARHGVWWEYLDLVGHAHCQTDFVLIGQRSVLVLECKLTYKEKAWEQLEELYYPVVGKALGLPVLGVVVAKGLAGRDGPPGQGTVVVHGLDEAVGAWKRAGPVAGEGHPRVVWHWTGASDIVAGK